MIEVEWRKELKDYIHQIPEDADGVAFSVRVDGNNKGCNMTDTNDRVGCNSLDELLDNGQVVD